MRPRSEDIFGLVLLAAFVALAGAVLRIGWARESWAWGAFAALGPAAALALFSEGLLERIAQRWPPRPRRGAYFAGCVLTMAVAVGVAAATRDWRLLLAAPVLGLAIGLALATATRGVAGLDGVDERLYFLPKDWPIIGVTAYALAWLGAYAWAAASARFPDATMAAFALLKLGAIVYAAWFAVWGLAWLARRLSLSWRTLLWVLRFVVFALLLGGPLLLITLQLYPEDQWPWVFLVDAAIVCAAFALWVRSELRAGKR